MLTPYYFLGPAVAPYFLHSRVATGCIPAVCFSKRLVTIYSFRNSVTLGKSFKIPCVAHTNSFSGNSFDDHAIRYLFVSLLIFFPAFYFSPEKIACWFQTTDLPTWASRFRFFLPLKSFSFFLGCSRLLGFLSDFSFLCCFGSHKVLLQNFKP